MAKKKTKPVPNNVEVLLPTELEPHNIPPDINQFLTSLPSVRKPKIVRHSPEVRALILTLRSNGYSYPAISKATGVATGSCYDICNDPEEMGLKDLSEKVKARLADRAYVTANTVLNRISDKDIDEASLLQKATTFGVLVDKARLMGGQSTENISVFTRRVNHSEDKIKNVDDEIRRLGGS